VVQLHLSRDCNRPSLAAEAARAVLAELSCAGEVHTARQDRPCATIELGAAPARRRRGPRTPRPRPEAPPLPGQAWLPGIEAE
jgi:hypothetical protein